MIARRKVVEAIEPHAVEIDGESWLIKRGERLASNHPAVRANPQYFTESGGPTSVIWPEKREPEAPPPEP